MDDLDNANAEKYLEFLLGDGAFATPLIEIREVIEFRAPKPIPHTAPYFKGVINVRGEIIGVVDLRQRLDIKGSDTPVALLVFETEHGPLAAMVDRVTSVTVIPESQIDHRSSGQAANADRNYFRGVGRSADRLITIITLKSILSKEQMAEARL
jgi:purine-binding chemotaxis protein CheW